MMPSSTLKRMALHIHVPQMELKSSCLGVVVGTKAFAMASPSWYLLLLYNCAFGISMHCCQAQPQHGMLMSIGRTKSPEPNKVTL